MSDVVEISLARVIELCRERDVRLAYEIGAFVVFEACEAVLDSPRVLRAGDVWVSSAGDTRAAEGPEATSPEAAAALAELLAGVLVVAGQEVPRMLLHLVDVDRAQALQLNGYRDELEAALVPLNRSAARRVLARQLRELARPKSERAGAGAHEAADADADVDALLGYSAPPGGASAAAVESEAAAAADGAPTASDAARVAGGGRRVDADSSSSPASAREAQTDGRDAGHSDDAAAHAAPSGGRDPDMRGIVEGDGRTRLAKLALAVAVALAVAWGLYQWFQGP